MLKNEFYINYFNKPLNLYNDKNLRGYKTLFFIKNENDLDNIWFHMNHFIDLQKGDLFGFINSLYFFYTYLKSDKKLTDFDKHFEFVIEESDEYFYWTTSSEYLIFIVNEHNLFFSEFEFKGTIDKLTFKLDKYRHNDNFESKEIQEKESQKNQIIKNNILINSSESSSSQEEQNKRVYSFIPKSKLLQLQHIGEELTVELMEIENGYEFNRKTVKNIVKNLHCISKVLHSYKETIKIADLMEDLAHFLKHYIEDVAEFEIEDIALFETLFSNFNTWLLLSFFDGTNNIQEYDSIIANNVKDIINRVNYKLDKDFE